MIGRPASAPLRRALIGSDTSAIPTPALVIDLAVLEANIRMLADRSRQQGIALRPHVKTHKCSTLAAMQVAAGAIGLSCATIDEAEVMAAAGLPGLLVTSPLVTRDKIDRLLALCRQHADIAVVADHPANVDALAAAVAAADLTLRVFVDLDVGQRRTGTATLENAVALAHRIAVSNALTLGGLQAYAGHLQHIVDRRDREIQAQAAKQQVARVRDAIGQAGFRLPAVTGSGTGTHDIDSYDTPFTELQAGSYVFMDEDYGRLAALDRDAWPFSVSLFVQTSFVSINVPGLATTDAGTKAFALNGPAPRVVTPPYADARYGFAGDEHGCIALAAGSITPALGTQLRCVVSHCDPTVSLYDRFYCVRDGAVVDVWPIDARGRR